MRDASATGLPSGSAPGIVPPQTVRLTLAEAFRSAGTIGNCGKPATGFACIATLLHREGCASAVRNFLSSALAAARNIH